jgi:hypothetical protein
MGGPAIFALDKTIPENKFKIMKILTAVFVAAILASVHADGQTNQPPATNTSSSTPTVETIVCLRHGEKPKAGLGQLTCRGLNRALALPDVLLAKYGTPQFVFAPNPTQKVDQGNYYYVRPLVTIEPTAIRCGLPIDTQFGFRDIQGLENELGKPEYQSATVFVAWEHGLLDQFVKNLLQDHGGNPTQVPAWPGNDYDTIFLVKITHSGKDTSVTFTIDHEDLNNLSDNCPQPAK